MAIYTIAHCLSLLALANRVVTTITLIDNGTVLDETRQPRVTGRIVKLYTGSRPEPIHCTEEGFKTDPADCSVFYRCVKSGHGKFIVFRFQCGTGTIYDPEIGVCNHPRSTKRSECGGSPLHVPQKINLQSRDNEIDSGLEQSPPSPIIINKVLFTTTNKKQMSTAKYSWVTTTLQPSQMSTIKLNRIVTSTPKQAKVINDICTDDGFVGDSENCRKFYRCVGNGRGGFIRYEFSCSETTIWDDEMQGCNHAWAVKRKRCGRGNDEAETTEKFHKNVAHDDQLLIGQTQFQQDYGNRIINKQGHQNIQQSKPQIEISSIKQQPPRKETLSNDRFQIQANKQSYGSDDTENDEAINDNSNSQDTTVYTSSTTAIITTTTTTSNNNNTDLVACSSSGFMGDPNDCKKFYRCVDNGKGSYIKYEFSCGDGTVWDSKIEGCNHAWAVKDCGKSPQAFTTSTQTTHKNTQQTTQMTHSTQNIDDSTTESEANDNDDSGYSNVQQSSTSSTENTAQSTNSGLKESDTVCTKSGFFGHKKNCKKFYRCVDNGNGSFTTYEFSCGDGTVWDPKIEACNHEWATEGCGEVPQDINKVEATTTKEELPTQQNTKRPSSSTSSETSQNDDYNDSYGQQSTTTTTETTKSPEIIESNDTICTSSGFKGDSNDCKKFYRCVDSGKNSFTRYDFSCGEGTVWDPEIEACNHAWAVKKCGNKATEGYDKIDETTIASSFASGEEDDNGYNKPIEQGGSSTTTSTSSSMTPETSGNTNECIASGFMGDRNDCKKFYRCVEDGKGGFVRFEFMCGDGTVWDPEIQACNHQWAVKHCGNQTLDGQIPSETTSTHESTTEIYHTQSSSEPTSSTAGSTVQSSSSICTKEGFIGDKTECKKFYRCVDNQHGGFIQYEFTCGEGTVWDSETQACNHPSNKKCGENEQNNIIHSTVPPQEHEHDEIENEATTTMFPKTTETSKEPPIDQGTCQGEGFYADNEDCKKFYRCVNDGRGGYTKYDFSCGEGTVWDQDTQACNHQYTNINCTKTTISSDPTSETNHQNQTSNYVTEVTVTSTSSSSNGNNDKCQSEGFYANDNDCKKFYRCVSDGKDGYTKYDFSCGQGTIWVQEIQACDHDNDLSSCSASVNNSPSSSETTISSTTQSQQTEREDDEYPSQNPSSSTTDHPSSDKCSAEGFYANANDCRKFYRCVDNGNGGYNKFDFDCGEGTAWDSDIQSCNHENNVKSCGNSNQSAKPQEETSQSTQTTSTTHSGSGQESQTSKPEGGTPQATQSTTTTNSGSGHSTQSSDKCEQEGYFGNSNDCTKFYRCVDNGNGGYTKYDFDCGDGTIWDQDVQTCNHPRDVANPSCKGGTNNEGSGTSTTSSSTSQTSSPTTSSTQSGSGTTEGTTQNSSNCSQDSSTSKPANNSISCPKAGFYSNPDDCKKFYRCVDWDGDGQRFSVFHFDCGEGTIWDPELETCNYENSVYPSRDCSKQSSSDGSTSSTTSTSSTEESTTTEDSTTTQKSTTESHTTNKDKTTSTTEETTTTTEKTTAASSTEQSTTSITKQPTTEQSTSTTEQATTTTKQSTTTTEQSTTTTTEQSTTTTEQSTTTTEQPTTTTEQSSSTTEESTSTTEQTTSTTQESNSTTEESTSTTEESTTSTTTEQSTTTTDESTTQQATSTTEQSSSTTEGQTDGTTTESSSEESSTESSSNKDCPETDDDQHLYVCPTGFRRHPKYCNLFYQCNEDDDNHEIKIAVFNCPNNTIYDESKTQCVDESEADKKCDGEVAKGRRLKRLDFNEKPPITVSRSKRNCPAVGHYPFEKNDECSPAFLKCLNSKSGNVRGYVYRCPDNYVYWSVSRRCEPVSKIRNCKNIDNSWSKRWEIPLEMKNIAS